MIEFTDAELMAQRLAKAEAERDRYRESLNQANLIIADQIGYEAERDRCRAVVEAAKEVVERGKDEWPDVRDLSDALDAPHHLFGHGPADWDPEQERWVCQAHGMWACDQEPECIAALSAANRTTKEE